MLEVRIQNTDQLIGYTAFEVEPGSLVDQGRHPTGWRFGFSDAAGGQRELVLLPSPGRAGMYAFYVRSVEEAWAYLPGFTPLDRMVGRGDALFG